MSNFLPMHEKVRLAALTRQGILHTGADARYDHLVLKAARLLSVPIAVIAFVDAERVWVKAEIGMVEHEFDRIESMFEASILQTSPLIIEDALADAMFCDGRHVVQAPYIRFYAGVAICPEERLPIGVFSVAADWPRRMDRLELQALSAWAHDVEDLLRADAALH